LLQRRFDHGQLPVFVPLDHPGRARATAGKRTRA
jgi:hypothetical protein